MKKKTDLGIKLGGIAGMNGIVSPVPGQSGRYLCRACGKRFTRKIPVFFAARCPHCGSFSVGADPMIVH